MADFDAMQTFAAVLRAGSFRGAAQALRIPRSTVSQRVTRLEGRLGVRLLERTTRTVTATAVGRDYFDRCTRILAEVEEADRAVTQNERTPRGVVRVASSLLFGHAFLSPIAAEFAARYPQVEIEVVVGNRRVNVVKEGFDLAVAFMTADEDSTLVARKLESVDHCCCASPAYLAARAAPSTPEHLGGHSTVVFGEARQTVWRFDSGSQHRRVPVEGRMSSNSFSIVRDAALSGVGIASLPTFACSADIREGRLVSLFPEWVVNRSEMRVLYPSNRYLPPRVRLFIDALVKGYGESLARERILDRRPQPDPPPRRSRRRKDAP
jgi:DNA-binding transcriptional LysR family regulator